jgi:glucose-6-phosphate isomerase
MSMANHPTLSARLQDHQRQLSTTHLSDLFQQDPQRAARMQITAAGLTLDYSRTHCDETTPGLFGEVVDNVHLRNAIADLMAGAIVNPTEQRPALHTALRSPQPPAAVGAEIAAVASRLQRFVARLRNGQLTGFSGKPISDVVSIGIGGSDLGPRMVVTALQPWHSGPRVHFVANIDPVELTDTLQQLDPASTLLITASKSFATLETRANSLAARAWIDAAAQGRDFSAQLVAITASPDKAKQFGIEDSNIFPMWDWVGGRYSLWSAIGLPIAIAIGWDNFQALLRGGAAMDEHYRSTDVPHNMPAMLALLECWYLDNWDAHSIAVLPYAHRLRLFPAFLQQLSMESLGKATTLDGRAVERHTGAVIWGEPGTNSQHSFMQLLHQGTRLIPVDFILPLAGETALAEQHAHLVANCLSQSRALMVGRSADEVRRELAAAGLGEDDINRQLRHRILPGNRPSNTISMQRLEPATLGALIALYEHKVHAQSVLWGINAFDQWGVELGKQIEGQVFPVLAGSDDGNALDASTRSLAAQFRQAVGNPRQR